MKFDFRLKLFVVSLGLTVFAFLGADLWLAPSFEDQLNDSTHEGARVTLDLMALQASSATLELDDSSGWNALAADLGRRTHGRVTIVRRDGRVLGDSGVPAFGLSTDENLSARPEIERALEGQPPGIDRVSEVEDGETDYLALPFRRDGEVIGVVRLALPLAQRNAANRRIERLVLIESGVACLAAILLWLGATHWLSRLLRKLTAAAREMARGDLDVRTEIAGTDEVAELGEALDKLAGNLSVAIRELREEGDLQVAILDGMQEGVLVLDRDRKILRHNPAVRSMLPFSNDPDGRALLDLTSHAELAAVLDGAESARGSVRTAEMDIEGPPTRRLYVSALVLPAQQPLLLVVFRDVTEIRRLETMRRDFVANVSHELRTPVASIRSAAETLGGAAIRRPEAAGRFVHMVSRNANRLQHLIDELLDLSRIESKELELCPERVHIRAFVEHALSMFRERALENRVELAVAVPSEAVVDADPHALEQVLTNLVDNAVKYCPGATVRVVGTQHDGVTELRVEDTGPGIAEDHLHRLFERFYRVDPGRSRDLGGTGLGLSIAKHLVERMRGSIAVESVLGRGSTFTVSLPRDNHAGAAPP